MDRLTQGDLPRHETLNKSSVGAARVPVPLTVTFIEDRNKHKYNRNKGDDAKQEQEN